MTGRSGGDVDCGVWRSEVTSEKRQNVTIHISVSIFYVGVSVDLVGVP